MPSDFRPITSSATIDDDANKDFSRQLFASRYATDLADFATGFGQTPYSGAAFADGAPSAEPIDLSSLLPNDLLDEKKFATGMDHRESAEKSTTSETDIIDKKRDTLELIGIVGVISDDDDSAENEGTTTASSAVDNTSELEADDYGSTTSGTTGVPS